MLSTRFRPLLLPAVLSLAVALAFSLTSCAPEPELSILADLVSEAAFAEVFLEPARLEVGTAAGRAYLGGGWSTRDEQDGHGSFVWAVGEASMLELPMLEKRDLQLEIELRPFSWPGSPPQGLRVFAAGVELAAFELAAGPSVVEVPLPASLQQGDRHEILLRWSWHRTPSEVLGAADRRPLAAAVYELRLSGLAGRPAEPPRAEQGRLWLPAGSRIDYYAELPADAELAVDEIAMRGAARLIVEVETEERGYRRPLASRRLDLPAGRQRLRLTCTGADGGALLVAPRLLAPAAAAAPDSVAQLRPEISDRSHAEGPSIILYSIDTLRADALGLYGGPVAAPAMRAFAEQALLFEKALAQSSWTKSSMASVLTGLSPPAHGAISRRHRLEPERVTLQELLSAAGYQTAAFSTNPNLTATFGFDQGFDHFEELPESAAAGEVVVRVERWLASRRDPDRPLFLWVHTLDPHSPYAPPGAARERWAGQVPPAVASASRQLLDDMRAQRRPRDEALLADLRTLYNAEIAYSDQVFGEFLGLLGQHGLADAVLLMLSDHGEEFYEHGNLEHGRALYQESVHVPMLLRLPGGPSARIEDTVQHVDILPTLLELAGVEAPAELPGRSLLPASHDASLGRGALGTERDLLLHLHLDGAERAALLRSPHKLLAERGLDGRLGRFRLYDLEQDPGETRNLAAERPLLRGWLAQSLRRALAASSEASEVELDPEMRRRLEALGYL